MDNIKNFLDFLFEKEQEAIYAKYSKERFEEYNNIVDELSKYMLEIGAGFNLPILKKARPDFFYLKTKDKGFPTKRYLYKISEYSHEKYNTIWACYTSGPNPGDGKTKMLTTCFFIARIQESLKLIVKLSTNPDTNKWEFDGGDNDKTLRLHRLKAPIKIERYLEPFNDDWSVEFYHKKI